VNNSDRLCALLQSGNLLRIPTCHDALSARLIQLAGFPAAFMSGFGVAAARLALPDTGLISFAEMLGQLRDICDALPGYPVIGDADTGFGNAMGVRRTVAQYAKAGAACVMIEDQVSPKRCGHLDVREVLSRDEARMKIRAAVDVAREVGILVLARTDARSLLGFEAALQRCRDFEEEGADIVFLEAPQSEAEIREYVQRSRKPSMVNMLVGGKTPYLSRNELESIGVTIAVYHPTLFAAVKAMQISLEDLKNGDSVPSVPAASLSEVKDLVGMADYDHLDLKYRSKEQL
jgi:2-methylisocitrate lyase-like PEP mutase family enzyme